MVSQYSSDKMSFDITVNAKYAPYIEFGTGKFVRVLSGYEECAMQFKGAGKRKVNRKAKPYLFATFERVKKALLQELNKMGFNERPVR